VRGGKTVRIAREVAEASRAATGKHPRGYPSTLVAEARDLERNIARRRKLRRELRALDLTIRHNRKMLKALAGAEQGEEL